VRSGCQFVAKERYIVRKLLALLVAVGLITAVGCKKESTPPKPTGAAPKPPMTTPGPGKMPEEKKPEEKKPEEKKPEDKKPAEEPKKPADEPKKPEEPKKP
jgi:hypothetical protein